MKLLIDAGNSRIKWAWQAGSLWSGDSSDVDCFDPARRWHGLGRPGQVVASVVSGEEIERAIRRWCVETWQIEPWFIAARAADLGVTSAYREPTQLGCDRWAALLGARAVTRENVAVVDAGTAVTADAMAADGRHLGGVILPGAELMRQALSRGTRRIGTPDPGPVTALGRSTGECVAGGTAFAVAGGVARVLGEFESVFTGPMEVIMTGGGAPALMPLLDRAVHHEPDLVLRGLARMEPPVS